MNKKSVFKILAIFAVLLLNQACQPKYYLLKTNQTQYAVDSFVEEDSLIKSFYQPYKSQLDSIMDDVVAISNKEIQKNQPEGLLNNFFADAIAQVATDKGITFDIAYFNYGGLRHSLPKGNISRANIFELMPFENTMATVVFKGEDIQHFFDFMAAEGGAAISKSSYKINKNTHKAVDILINGSPIDKSKDYIILTSDYMVNGGDSGKVFYRAVQKVTYDYKLRDVLLEYLEKENRAGKKLNPVLDGRIAIK